MIPSSVQACTIQLKSTSSSHPTCHFAGLNAASLFEAGAYTAALYMLGFPKVSQWAGMPAIVLLVLLSLATLCFADQQPFPAKDDRIL
jgi:hypothetical protein